MKIALLSNINMNYVVRILNKDFDIYQNEGYGNELGTLLNDKSSYYVFSPDITFFLIDIMELISHNENLSKAKDIIENWYSQLETAIVPEKKYYISDAVLTGRELDLISPIRKGRICELWNRQLYQLMERHSNIRIFEYEALISSLGRGRAFSNKMWYMGKILLSNEAQIKIAAAIRNSLDVENRVPKKVLLLDLDNTLWGGLAGEADVNPVILSDENFGMIYKDAQRIIKLMKERGTVLAIVSKNNEKDAMEIIDKNPHMVLDSTDFAVKKINWLPKHENIQQIAEELNLGLDSFVFWDDSPVERELIKKMLPQVTVPDFPTKAEAIPDVLLEVFHQYFETGAVTKEDREKTEQYVANMQRKNFQEKIGSFEEYCRELKIVISHVSPIEYKERIVQLINKTNQFNLTTRRYTEQEISDVLTDSSKEVFTYRVSDRFGDNGVVAIVIIEKQGTAAKIEEFAMSCRVMGRLIENAIMEDFERQLYNKGIRILTGIYIPSAKNIPVKELYEKAGYSKTDKENEYVKRLDKNIHYDYEARME